MDKCKYCKQIHDSSELCKPSRRTFLFLSGAAITSVALLNKLGMPNIVSAIKYSDGRTILTELEIVRLDLMNLVEEIPMLFTDGYPIVHKLKEL